MLNTIGAMAFARTVAAEFVKVETGYRNGLYGCIGMALTSYRKFLKDPADYKDLLGEPNISVLPEKDKPRVEETSRLVLYFHTGAKTDDQRNTAGKYARIVDYLHKERVENAAAAAERIRKAGGIVEILKEARGREAPKGTRSSEIDANLQEDDPDFNQGEEADEAHTGTSASGHSTDKLFDPHQDLSIRVKAEVHAQVLGPEIAMEEEFYLKCKKTGTVGRDGIRIVGRLVDPPSE